MAPWPQGLGGSTHVCDEKFSKKKWVLPLSLACDAKREVDFQGREDFSLPLGLWGAGA